MPLTPEQRQLQARLAAYTRWSRYDSKEGTQKAREAFFDRFRTQVDPDGILPPAERERRATAAMNAHMAGMAFKSAKVRKQRAGT